jgi:streptogramin lyase
VGEWQGLTTEGTSFHQPISLAAAPDGSIYLLDADAGRLVRMTADGIGISSWVLSREKANQEHGGESAVAAGGNAVYVSSTAEHCIFHLDLEGRIRDRYPFSCHQNGLAVDRMGQLYVSGDRLEPTGGSSELIGNKKYAIWKLNRQGDVMDHWNVPANGPLAVGPEGAVWAVTRAFEGGPPVVRRLSPFGVMLSEWELSGVSPWEEIGALAIDARRHAFLTLPRCGIVVELDRQGREVRRWSRTAPGGPPLSLPTGVAVDSRGDLYIADWAGSRVVKYDPETRR